MFAQTVNPAAALPLWSVVPFAGLLLSMALLPLVADRFWASHYEKICLIWSLLFAAPFVIFYKTAALTVVWDAILTEYLPFIILLWTLYTISSGIVFDLHAPPGAALNVVLLLAGTLLASWIGTTGAAMLMIRPLLRMNAHRRRKAHVVVFFIFLVCNIGGILTPMGDPPLFLGFLHGVPFFWTLHLLPHFVFVAGCLLLLFYAIDRHLFRLEAADSDRRRAAVPQQMVENAKQPFRFEFHGRKNLLLISIAVLTVFLSGKLQLGELRILGVTETVQDVLRSLVLLTLGVLSLKITPAAIFRTNSFSWHPIKEVAIIFAGIFITIIPALAFLKEGASGKLGGLLAALSNPAHYFWATGIISSFLDNAPTYLTFLNTTLGNYYAGLPESEAVARLISEREIYLVAVSAGAVFMGAMTYIGNAPNFMVKSIAGHSGVKMPGFFAYLLTAALILIPLFLLMTIVFFSQHSTLTDT